jgi:hypothetical protein
MVDAGGKTISLFPFILPFLFNGGGIILGHSNLPSIISGSSAIASHVMQTRLDAGFMINITM